MGVNSSLYLFLFLGLVSLGWTLPSLGMLDEDSEDGGYSSGRIRKQLTYDKLSNLMYRIEDDDSYRLRKVDIPDSEGPTDSPDPNANDIPDATSNAGKNQELCKEGKMPKCNCPDYYMPVCANNGWTYKNICVFYCARQCNTKYEIAHKGKCYKSRKILE